MNKPGTEAYKKYRSSEKFRSTSLNGHLKRHYGITLEEYMERFEAQGGVCKVCGGTDTRQWRDGRIQRLTLFVDHDHESNCVRGLLCNKCNVGIAMFGDDEKMLMSAINYLRKS